MKAFIISLILTIILVIAVIANAIYISRITEQMKSLVTEICRGSSRDKAFEELNNIWAHNKSFFTISVGFDEIDHVTEYVTRLGFAIEEHDDIGIRRNCALLENFLSDVTRHESISLLNIF